MFVCMLWGCVSQATHDKALRTIDSLRLTNQTLLEENEELLNGEQRIINYIELHSNSHDILKSYDFICKLKSKHPESKYISQNKNQLIAIENEARIILDSINKVKQDSIRLANIHELGIWEIGAHVDDFGEPTGERFVYSNVLGVFGNSATANSTLRVHITSSYEDSLCCVCLAFDEYNDGTYEYEDIINI